MLRTALTSCQLRFTCMTNGTPELSLRAVYALAGMKWLGAEWRQGHNTIDTVVGIVRSSTRNNRTAKSGRLLVRDGKGCRVVSKVLSLHFYFHFTLSHIQSYFQLRTCSQWHFSHTRHGCSREVGKTINSSSLPFRSLFLWTVSIFVSYAFSCKIFRANVFRSLLVSKEF